MKIVILTIIALIQCITSVILGWSMLVAVIGSIKGNKKEKAKKIYNKNFKFHLVLFCYFLFYIIFQNFYGMCKMYINF